MADSAEAKQKEGQKSGLKPSRKRSLQKQSVSTNSGLAGEQATAGSVLEQRPAVSPVSGEAAHGVATLSRFAHDFSRVKTHTEIQPDAMPGPAVQRHPPGAPLLGGTATASGGGGGSAGGAGGATPEPVGATTEGGGQSSASAAGASSAPGAAQTPGGASPGGAAQTGAGGPSESWASGLANALGGAAAAASAAAEPTTVSMPTLQTAYAQNALQTAFGGVAGRTMITGTIHIVANNTALLAEYDAIMIRNAATNRDTGVTWVAGDKQRWNDSRNVRTNAFAYSGEIWIDATQTDPTATVHEMLHVNTASGFLGTAGRAINEGITQRLAVRAVLATGQSVAGSENTYQQEQAVVAKLVDVVGEGVVQEAYFNSPSMLVTAYEALNGPRSFAILKLILNDTPEGYTAALLILQPPSTGQKILAIRTLLSWFVSESDLDIIESILSTCSADEKAEIARGVRERIFVSLTNIFQRVRILRMLGLL